MPDLGRPEGRGRYRTFKGGDMIGAPLSQMIRRHKTLTILIVVLVILPLISIVCFPYFMSLTVPPDRILVFEITEEKAGEGAIVHLNDQNIRDYPVLEEVLLKNESVQSGSSYKEGDLRRVGEIDYPEKITQATVGRYFVDNITSMRKYFEYWGRYYRIVGIYQD